jgi:hypothetical protein
VAQAGQFQLEKLMIEIISLRKEGRETPQGYLLIYHDPENKDAPQGTGQQFSESTLRAFLKRHGISDSDIEDHLANATY